MKKAPIPANEPQRLQCLLSMSVLDTKPEERFDRLTRIARSIFGVPIVLVSLIDSERQWFKSNQGMDAQETPRDISFCGHAILNNGIFFVTDALNDDRFSDNPLVTGPPKIRFYAGMPLAGTDGSKVGTLCLIDTKPRALSDDDISTLRDLADCVEDELVLSNKKILEERLSKILNNVSDGVVVVDDNGEIELFNPSAEKIFGYSSEHIVGKNVNSFVSDSYQGRFYHYFKGIMEENDEYATRDCVVEAKRSDKSTIEIQCKIISTPIGRKKSYTVIIKDKTRYDL